MPKMPLFGIFETSAGGPHDMPKITKNGDFWPIFRPKITQKSDLALRPCLSPTHRGGCYPPRGRWGECRFACKTAPDHVIFGQYRNWPQKSPKKCTWVGGLAIYYKKSKIPLKLYMPRGLARETGAICPHQVRGWYGHFSQTGQLANF